MKALFWLQLEDPLQSHGKTLQSEPEKGHPPFYARARPNAGVQNSSLLNQGIQMLYIRIPKTGVIVRLPNNFSALAEAHQQTKSEDEQLNWSWHHQNSSVL